MENFITGYPANEEAQRQAMLQALGPEKYAFFFDRFLTYFFTEDDARFVKSLGLNLMRIPVNYRHLEDDMAPFVIKEEGFQHLDRAIDLCAGQGIYTIIDLHALPGYQNTTGIPITRRTRRSSGSTSISRIARSASGRRSRGATGTIRGWRATTRSTSRTIRASSCIMPDYRRLVDAIRAMDPNHLIFLEGNRYSMDFHMFGEPWPGVVYTNHDYALPGFMMAGPIPASARGRYVDNEVLEETFLARASTCSITRCRSGWASSGRSTPAIRRPTRCATRCCAISSTSTGTTRELVDLALQRHRLAGGGLCGGG